MSVITFGLIGCGSIGKRHMAVLDADARARVVQLCDIDDQAASTLSETYAGIPYATDYRELLENEQIDCVSICTPHALHAPMAIEAAKKGKHILVEKPMALTVSDGESMIEAAKKHNVKLFVVKQNRFNVPIQLTTNALKEGKLGKIYMVQCEVLWNRHAGYYQDSDWRGKKEEEGGALFTQVSHFIDLLVWWFGDVEQVAGYMATRQHPIEIEDQGHACLEFANGSMGTLIWTTNVYNKNYEGSITLIGENGTIKIGGPYLNKIDYWDVQSFPIPDHVQFIDLPNMYGKYQGTSSNHDKVITQVIKDLLQHKGEVVAGQEGLKTVAAIEKIYNSIRTI